MDNILGVEIKVTDTTTHTKDRILLESARLFAIRGYDAVSIRDIATAINLGGPSIYGHYAAKEDILNDILDKAAMLFDVYYVRLAEANKAAQSIEEIMANFFVELKVILNLFAYYGIAIAQSMMHWHEGAKKLIMESFFGNGILNIRSTLDEAIERGLVQPFNTEAVARLIMNTVNSYSGQRIAENEGILQDVDFADLYQQMEQFLLDAVKTARFSK